MWNYKIAMATGLELSAKMALRLMIEAAKNR